MLTGLGDSMRQRQNVKRFVEIEQNLVIAFTPRIWGRELLWHEEARLFVGIQCALVYQRQVLHLPVH